MQRRTAVRYRCAVGTAGRLAFPDGRDSREVWVCNLSESGIGLNLPGEPLEPGTLVTVRLHGRTPESAVTLAAHVVHNTAEADGTWRVGCMFSERLSAQALTALL
jgi:hypothetical protein